MEDAQERMLSDLTELYEQGPGQIYAPNKSNGLSKSKGNIHGENG